MPTIIYSLQPVSRRSVSEEWKNESKRWNNPVYMSLLNSRRSAVCISPQQHNVAQVSTDATLVTTCASPNSPTTVRKTDAKQIENKHVTSENDGILQQKTD